MASKVIGNQLSNVANLYKSTIRSLIQKDGRYIVPKDYAGTWTTGYIADMGLLTKEEAATEAKLLEIKNKLTRYVTEEDQDRPKLASVIPPEEGEPVTDVISDFRDEESVELIGETQRVRVKGRYLAHFIKNYPQCEFRIVGNLKPVKVINETGGELLGLIMPIKSV